jgi:hypothetical protein
MIVATYGEGAPLAGKAIEYEDGRLSVRETPSRTVTAEELVALDDKGEIDWAYVGLREWAQGLVAYPPRGRSRLLVITGFILPLVGLAVLCAALVAYVGQPDQIGVPLEVVTGVAFAAAAAGCALSAVGYGRAKREGRPTGWAVAGIAVGVAVAVAAVMYVEIVMLLAIILNLNLPS